jgi:hypothetical protein
MFHDQLGSEAEEAGGKVGKAGFVAVHYELAYYTTTTLMEVLHASCVSLQDDTLLLC